MRQLTKVKEYINKIKRQGFINTIRRSTWFRIDLIEKTIVSFLTKNKRPLDAIVIESHNDFDCNGGAFYDYLIANGINKNHKIIWLLKNTDIPELPVNVYAFNYWKPSIKKNYYITNARVLLSDNNIIEYSKKSQISIYCTHGGCTFKNVKGLLVVPDKVTYILSSSEAYDPYMCNNYSIPYPNERMLHIGFPSNDALFRTNGNEFMKISKERFDKYILWMPTFRVGDKIGRIDGDKNLPYGIPLFENNDQIERVNKILTDMNCMLVIKIHPVQNSSKCQIINEQSNIFVLDGESVKQLGIDNYRLMASSDAFISDYSSATYSYLMLNRPIGFAISDIDSYKVGFSVDDILQFMPGNIIYNENELIDFIKDVVFENDNYAIQREKLLNWLYKYKDGNSCMRLAKFLKLYSGGTI